MCMFKVSRYVHKPSRNFFFEKFLLEQHRSFSFVLEVVVPRQLRVQYSTVVLALPGYCTVQSYSSATVLYRYCTVNTEFTSILCCLILHTVADRQNMLYILYMYVSCSLTSHI